MNKDIQQNCYFTQSPKEVWEYLTNGDLIEQWLGKTDFKPIVGHKFQFANSCETHDKKQHFTFCKVLEIIPNKLLSYSWQKGTTENEINLDSVVRWTLAEKNGGTELTLEHTGFKLLGDTMAHTEGWNQCLKTIMQLINADNHANANF